MLLASLAGRCFAMQILSASCLKGQIRQLHPSPHPEATYIQRFQGNIDNYENETYGSSSYRRHRRSWDKKRSAIALKLSKSETPPTTLGPIHRPL